MASNARIFFAGVGTTFAILAIGFGGGVLLANSALHDPAHQVRASSEPPSSGMRVILPASAEPALPVSLSAAVPTNQPQTQPELQPASMSGAEKPIEKADVKKSERDSKVERRRQAERKARRMASQRARHQIERGVRSERSIMAFGGDESRVNFFGN
jgi:hypothetical protein